MKALVLLIAHGGFQVKLVLFIFPSEVLVSDEKSPLEAFIPQGGFWPLMGRWVT
ncbi:hypothetical protein [Peribacillus simplex]|uniref:hypothetical protein n=1 Tax=Peribacillus simplex TaxID=1478 RepID=UPI001C880580|nr:hypothetical protein [Peribacillus simplex]